MKKLFFAAALLLAMGVHAQDKELFTYITKSLKDDINGGRNLKDGYTFAPWTDGVKPSVFMTKYFATDSFAYWKCYSKEQPDSLVCLVLVQYIQRNKECRRAYCIPKQSTDNNLIWEAYDDLQHAQIKKSFDFDLYWRAIRYIAKITK